MGASELGEVIFVSLISTVIVAAGAALVLLLARRLPLWGQLGVFLSATVMAVVISMLAVANRMYLSEHDLVVAVNTTVVSGVVSLILMGAVAALGLRRFRRLTRAVERLGRGDQLGDIGPQPSREFQAVADELKLTNGRLVASRARESRIESSRRELAGWISHDLRTPLAGILSMAEALQDGMVDDPARYHERIAHHARHMAGMVDDLFELSRIDSGSLELSDDRVSLRELAEDTIAAHQPMAGRRSIRLETPGPLDVEIVGDGRELLRALSNLLLNAIQHTSDGSSIRVVLRVVDGAPIISVIDSGDGVPESARANVFAPGWRGAEARSKSRAGQATGAGLGLAIVRGILRAHGGDVTMTNMRPGCRFDLLLPADRVTDSVDPAESHLQAR